MSQVWMFLCCGISYCSEFSTTTNYHAARESLSRLVASEIFPKFGDFVEREETRVNSCNREKKLLFLHTSFTLPRSRLFIFRLDLLSGQRILSFLFLLAQHFQLVSTPRIVRPILGDPGAVSRVGRKGRTKVFK